MTNRANESRTEGLDLTGCRVLVVEDEYYIADDISRALELCGAVVVGPYPSLTDAMRPAESERLTCAVLDINLRGESGFEIAKALRRRNISFIYSTGYQNSLVPDDLKGMIHLEKPFRMEELLNAVHQICQQCERSDTPALT
jgi:DNA-binding response OmpR family regulator